MKTALAFLLAALLALTSACSPGGTNQNDDPASIPEWTVTVAKADGETSFSSADAATFTPVTIEATTKNKNGESTTSTYTGVKLADVLAGVSDFSSVTIVASDGFSADYDKELALAGDTILAWEKDGEIIDDVPPLQMAPKQGTGNQFVKSVVKITVNP